MPFIASFRTRLRFSFGATFGRQARGRTRERARVNDLRANAGKHGRVERERRGNGRPARARRTKCAKCETYELRASRAGINKRANECQTCQVRKARQEPQAHRASGAPSAPGAPGAPSAPSAAEVLQPPAKLNASFSRPPCPPISMFSGARNAVCGPIGKNRSHDLGHEH